MSQTFETVRDQVRAHFEQRESVRIQGLSSKAFFGRDVEGSVLALDKLNGISTYEPTELVLTAKAGTPLRDIEAALTQASQMLPFEPPQFAGSGSLGGAVATGLSGPRRPFAGPLRDYVLGTTIVDGRGQILKFGGEVMKNVAGYDVSRLMAGAHGTLGVLLDVSLKVLPRPTQECSLVLEMDAAEGLARMLELSNQPLPISGLAHVDGVLRVRLSGAPSSVAAARAHIGGSSEPDNRFWRALRDHELAFFDSDLPLWRVALPPATPALALDARTCLDWAGTQRWLLTRADANTVRAEAARFGGHAICFRRGVAHSAPLQPLPDALGAVHKRLKEAFDPAGILNPGRMYAQL